MSARLTAGAGFQFSMGTVSVRPRGRRPPGEPFVLEPSLRGWNACLHRVTHVWKSPCACLSLSRSTAALPGRSALRCRQHLPVCEGRAERPLAAQCPARLPRPSGPHRESGTLVSRGQTGHLCPPRCRLAVLCLSNSAGAFNVVFLTRYLSAYFRCVAVSTRTKPFSQKVYCILDACERLSD